MGEGIVLGFESAQLVWRRACWQVARDNPADESHPPLLVRLLFDEGRDIVTDALPRPVRVTTIPARVDVRALEELARRDPELAEHACLCVGSHGGRRYLGGTHVRLTSGTYPTGSLCRLPDGTLVASPELTFLQMARVLDQERLVQYGFELCGYYARGRERRSFTSCPALTSVARMSAYLDRLERVRRRRGEGMPWGAASARRALRHVIDGAASAEEAAVATILSLPCRQGGYGLPAPRLNRSVALGAVCAGLFGIDRFVCDLSWNDGRQVLEYQGSQHKLRSRGTFDMRKGNVLLADGRDVVEMDRAMLGQQTLMDEVAKSLARALGLRWRQPSAELATRRIRLRNRLIALLDE